MPSTHPKVAFSIQDMINLYISDNVMRKKGRNDRIEKNREGVTYYLFDNEIAHYSPKYKTVSFRDAGYRTATTRNRLNHLGLDIAQCDYVWYSKYGKDGIWPGEVELPIEELIK